MAAKRYSFDDERTVEGNGECNFIWLKNISLRKDRIKGKSLAVWVNEQESPGESVELLQFPYKEVNERLSIISSFPLANEIHPRLFRTSLII